MLVSSKIIVTGNRENQFQGIYFIPVALGDFPWHPVITRSFLQTLRFHFETKVNLL